MKNKITKLSLILLVSSFAVNAQTEIQKQQILAKSDVSFLEKSAKEYSLSFNKNIKLAQEKAITLGFPLEGVNEDGTYYQLVGFYEGTNDLKYYKNYSHKIDSSVDFFNNRGENSSLKTLRASYLHNKNIVGKNMTVGEWDGGQPLLSHFSLLGRVTLLDNGATPQNGSPEHATHVAGTMISKGGNSLVLQETKGFLPEGNLKAANWDNDLSEMTAAAAAGLLVSNHSYGPSASQPGFSKVLFGQYNSEARAFDLLANAQPYYTIVSAAGNDRRNYTSYQPNKGGRDLLTTMSVSKNTVTVAAIEGISSYNNPSSVVMSAFSNWGPTDDYRIKPDISAKGVDVFSLSNSGPLGTTSMDGTSMAAPAITGAIGLWQEYYYSLFQKYMLSSTVKALMAHTALEAGPADGPDFMFGWGVMNIEDGAKVMEDVLIDKAWVLEEELLNGDKFVQTFDYDGISDLKITIAWNDPAGTATSGDDQIFAKLVNDLDLRIINLSTNDVYYPWMLKANGNNAPTTVKGDNKVDNIEKIEIKGVPEGNYKLEVAHKGTLRNNKQLFSLVVSGSGTTLKLGTEQYLLKQVNVFPNPVGDDVINVSFPKEIIGDMSYEVLDINGKVISKGKQLIDNKVKVTGLSSGVYLLRLNTSIGSSSYKFIKK